MRENFSDPFLRNLDDTTLAKIDGRRDDWGLGRSEFYRRLESWFANFQDRDKDLALKIFLSLDYYNERRFARRIEDLRIQVVQFLHQAGATIADLLLVVPDHRGDSADRHAYDVIKSWGLAQRQIVTISGLATASADTILVFFNDTHGTGNQFVREAGASVAPDRAKAMFIVSITMAQTALRRFKYEFPRAKLLPELPSTGVRDLFTSNEVRRIRELGSLVYKTHPMGYGGSGLLVAYYFQCPNNTLPLVWADSKTGNNTVDGVSYPWSALFPYEPKAKPRTQVAAPQLSIPPPRSLLDPSSQWHWSPNELARLVTHIASWRLDTPSFYSRVGSWFDNFRPDERQLALDVFLSTTYLDVGKTRDGIQRIGQQILTDIYSAGGDHADIVLVTTGDRKNSVYHYVFDFLREWKLDSDQVVGIDRLSPDMAIDKTLVFFYHTRSGDHFLRARAGDATYAELVSRLHPRATFVAAYAITPAARTGQSQSRLAYLEEVSRTVADLLPQHADQIRALEHELQPESRPCADEILLAYYFQCPKVSSPLLWTDRAGDVAWRRWSPLFRHIEVPK